MKKFTLTSKFIGNKKNRTHSLKNNKLCIVGNTNYKFNMFINNKYIINKHFKFNGKASNNVYNNIFFCYKK